MTKIERLAAYVLFLVLVLWAPASSYAESPFDGTWCFNTGKSKLSPKPYVWLVNGGIYECSSCSPKIHVKADGQDQPVTGQFYDTISVREVDRKSIAITMKKNGKTVTEQIRTVSHDGNALTLKLAYHPENSDQTVSRELTFARVGKAPAGANGTSGSWRFDEVNKSENGVTVTFKSSGDELSMSQPTGESYAAKLDGKDYPVKGEYDYNSVSLKRVDDRTIEQTDKRDGKIVGVSKKTVSRDGKKMTTVNTSKLTGRTETDISEKQ
jgi:hypothetical protein